MIDDEKFYRELGLRVQRLRRKLGLTQESLASLVSLTRTSIVNIEKGRQKVLAHTVAAIARALRTSPSELLPDATERPKLDELLRTAPKPEQEFVRAAIASTLQNKA